MDHKQLTGLGAQLVAGRYILNGAVVATHTNDTIALTEAGLALRPKASKTPAKSKAEPEPAKDE